jgi:hypothetical protein
MKQLRKYLATAVAAAALGLPAGAAAQDRSLDPKPQCAIAATPKDGLSKDDREIAARYLAENSRDLRGAPRALVTQLMESQVWTAAFGAFAQPVPRRLDRRLSAPAPNTLRVIFNGALLVVNTKTGRVVDWVGPEE